MLDNAVNLPIPVDSDPERLIPVRFLPRQNATIRLIYGEEKIVILQKVQEAFPYKLIIRILGPLKQVTPVHRY